MYLKSKDIIFFICPYSSLSEKLKITIKSFEYKNKYSAVVPIGAMGTSPPPPFSVKS